MNPVIEFIYWWALSEPSQVGVLKKDGTYDVIYEYPTLRGAIQGEHSEEPALWKLPSGRWITTDEVNEFLRKYII